MKKYSVCKNDNNIEEFDSLFDAYLSVNTDDNIIPVKEYLINKLTDSTNINDLSGFTTKSIELITPAIISQKQSRYNVPSIDELYVLLTNSDKYLVVDNDNFINLFNSLLNSQAVINKSKDFLKRQVKNYLYNHFWTFIDITEYLVDMCDEVSFTAWTKQSLEEYTDKDINYKATDKYNLIKNGILYSANEFKVMYDWMHHINDIVELIIDNKDDLIKHIITPSDLAQILSQ